MSEREILPLPCPFCGSADTYLRGDGAAVRWVECRDCEADGPLFATNGRIRKITGGRCATSRKAIAAWNAAPRPQTCESDAVAETCKEGHDHTGYIDGCRVPSEGEPPAVILCPNCGMAHYSGPCSGAKEVDYDEEGEEAGP